MSENIPEKYADLLEKPAFGNLGTLMKDGSPQVTPVWVDYDGKHVRINSALGRVKDKNIRRDPRVSISLQDPANPLSLSRNSRQGRRDHSERRRRSHRQALAKIFGQARLPVPPTRRSPRPLQDRARKSQLHGLKKNSVQFRERYDHIAQITDAQPRARRCVHPACGK